MLDYPKPVYYLVLSMIPGIGPRRIKALYQFCKEDVANVFQLEPALIAKLTRKKESECKHLFHNQTLFNQAQKEYELCLEKDIRITTWEDSTYPSIFHELSDPPPVIFTRGTFYPVDVNAIAIVGTRTPTHWSKKQAHRIAFELAVEGITIVSGVARGIDGEAHRGALDGGGRTIGVLGCGLDVIYPREHARLYDSIAEQGVLLSEFPLHAKPERFHFPQRNRLIAILSLGILLVEGASDSGSLITARKGLEMGREVYALPGPSADAKFAGNNSLIREGALLVESAAHIIQDLGGTLDLNLIQRNTPPVNKKNLGFESTDPKKSKRQSDQQRSSESLDSPAQKQQESPELNIQNEQVQTFAKPHHDEHPPVDVSPTATKLLMVLSEREKIHLDILVNETGIANAEVAVALMELEMQGLVERLPGNFYIKA
jgi:DNA processing protein